MDDLRDFLLTRLDKLDSKLEEIKDQNVRTSVLLEAHELKDDHLREDVKKLSEHFIVQEKQLYEYNSSLRDHMRRTELLEDTVLPMKAEYDSAKAVQIYTKEKTKKTMWIISSILAILGALAGIISHYR